jgi:hypothetical protein
MGSQRKVKGTPYGREGPEVVQIPAGNISYMCWEKGSCQRWRLVSGIFKVHNGLGYRLVLFIRDRELSPLVGVFTLLIHNPSN